MCVRSGDDLFAPVTFAFTRWPYTNLT